MIYLIMPYKVRLMDPAVDFLDEMPDKLRAKVLRSIGLLKEFGPMLREPHAKRVPDWPGLFELRVDLADLHVGCSTSGIARPSM